MSYSQVYTSCSYRLVCGGGEEAEDENGQNRPGRDPEGRLGQAEAGAGGAVGVRQGDGDDAEHGANGAGDLNVALVTQSLGFSEVVEVA